MSCLSEWDPGLLHLHQSQSHCSFLILEHAYILEPFCPVHIGVNLCHIPYRQPVERPSSELLFAESQVDPSVSFEQVGGLDKYIKSLKEMVFLPLVYPELFERFHVQPPRGVLFYGPPGASAMLYKGPTLTAASLMTRMLLSRLA